LVVNDSEKRIWKKIALFYGLTMLFSGVFDAFILFAGKMDAEDLLDIGVGCPCQTRRDP
jgi:hypothetical protein